MSLMSQRVTLHFRAEQTGEDALGEPIYGTPTDVPNVPAWWEPAGSTEDTAAAELVARKYWLYTEDTRVTNADAVTLAGPVPLRCELGAPQYQPGGFVVDGYVRVLVEVVTG